MPQNEILTAEEVAKYLRVHPYTIKRLARTGKLPGFKVGGQWRFGKSQISASFDHPLRQANRSLEK